MSLRIYLPQDRLRAIANNGGIEAAEIIPGYATRFDIQDLTACFTPRKGLILSATEDKYSQDFETVIQKAKEICKTAGVPVSWEHKRYTGWHALTQERFDAIVQRLIKHL